MLRLTARPPAPLLRALTHEEAIALCAGKTEKPSGVDPRTWFHPEDALHTVLLHGCVPVPAFAANESGDRYDGTVCIDRARAYAQRTTEPPPVIATLGRHSLQLRILDGGHRLSAARMAGRASLPTIVRVKRNRLDAVRCAWSAEALAWGVDPAVFESAALLENSM